MLQTSIKIVSVAELVNILLNTPTSTMINMLSDTSKQGGLLILFIGLIVGYAFHSVLPKPNNVNITDEKNTTDMKSLIQKQNDKILNVLNEIKNQGKVKSGAT